MMGPQASSFPATKPALSCDRSMCTIARQISSKQLCIPRLIYASSGASGIICITKRASPDLDKVPSASVALQVQKLPAPLEPCAVELLSLFPTHICNQRHHSTQMKFEIVQNNGWCDQKIWKYPLQCRLPVWKHIFSGPLQFCWKRLPCIVGPLLSDHSCSLKVTSNPKSSIPLNE